MKRIHNIWQEYGFSRNPCHTVHLGVSQEDSRLYVNRELLENQLGTFLLSEDRGVVFVEGSVGVGKTSFVNQTQYLIMRQHHSAAILPAQRVVEVQNNNTATEILFSILGGVLRSLAAFSPACVKKKGFAKVEGYLRKAHIVSWNASAGIAGFGGGPGRTNTPTEPVIVPLQTIQSLFEDTACLAAEEGFKKITVLINNLDNVEEEHFFQILHDVRDTLLDRIAWLYILIAPPGMRYSLGSNRNHRRISEKITGEAVSLTPHSLTDVHRILEKRVECFRLSDKKQAPVPLDVIDTLYKASGGEIRYILKSAQSTSAYLVKFHDRNLLELTRTGKQRLYTPRGDVALFFKGTGSMREDQ